MFDSAADFRYTTGADIDADHPHGDLDRIRLQGIDLMPNRNAVKDPLYGKDIAFLMEAALERASVYSQSSRSYEFTRKLSAWQLGNIVLLFEEADQSIHWIDPDLSVSEQPIPNISGYRRLDTLLGAAAWQIPRRSTWDTFIHGDGTLARSNVLNLFETAAAMMRFVDNRGGERLTPTGYQYNDGKRPIDFQSQALGWIHASYVLYEADLENNGDGTYKITGYEKEYDSEWYATAGFVWQMPTPECLVGKTKEVWVLLECEVFEEIGYDPSGTQSSYDIRRQEVQRSELSVYRLVKCVSSSEQAITAGGYLRIPSPDVSTKRGTLLQQAGKSRWTGMQSPPQGVLRHCGQRILSQIVAVYPVWEISHTAV